MLTTCTPLSRVVTAALFALSLSVAGAAAARVQAQTEPAIEKLYLTAGRSIVATTQFDIVRIAVTNPAVADATVVQPREILVDGKGPGTVSLIVWGVNTRQHYDVVVGAGVLGIEQRLRALFPGEDIQVTANDEALILSGNVSNTNVALRVAEIAGATSAKMKVMNLLQYPGGDQSQQVRLPVRFA